MTKKWKKWKKFYYSPQSPQTDKFQIQNWVTKGMIQVWLPFQSAYPRIPPSQVSHKSYSIFPQSRDFCWSHPDPYPSLLNKPQWPSGGMAEMHCTQLMVPSWDAANHSAMGAGPVLLTGSIQCIKLKTEIKFTFILLCSRPEATCLNKTCSLPQPNYLMQDMMCFSNC